MNTLTHEQRKELIDANSIQYDGRGKVETAICWLQALDAAFALGVAQGREECAKAAAKFEPESQNEARQ